MQSLLGNMAAKRCNSRQVNDFYKQAYREIYDWHSILNEGFYSYVDIISKAFNCPITTLMSGIIPLKAALGGPLTKMMIRDTFSIPLNTFVTAVVAPGRAKSYVYSIISEVAEQLMVERF